MGFASFEWLRRKIATMMDGTIVAVNNHTTDKTTGLANNVSTTEQNIKNHLDGVVNNKGNEILNRINQGVSISQVSLPRVTSMIGGQLPTNGDVTYTGKGYVIAHPGMDSVSHVAIDGMEVTPPRNCRFFGILFKLDNSISSISSFLEGKLFERLFLPGDIHDLIDCLQSHKERRRSQWALLVLNG